MSDETLNSDPVTIVRTHFVKPGFEKEFEDEIIRLSEIFSQYPGYLGVNFFRPLDSADGDYRIVLKFRSEKDHKNWRASEDYKKWEEIEKKITIAPPRTYKIDGLETWFTLPGNRVMKPPGKERQLLVTWLAIWPVISVLGPIEGIIFGELPYILQNMINVAILVFLMTYIVMPFMTKLFRKFLYPKGTRKILDENNRLLNEY